MPTHRLPPAPVSPLDHDGAPVFGTFEGATGPVDWFAGPRRPAPRRRWKRWHYVSVGGPEVLMAAAVVHVGWAVSGFAYLFDRRAGRLLADVSVTGLPGRSVVVSPEPMGEAVTTLHTRRLSVRLARRPDGWRLEARSPAMTVDATLTEADAPTLCAIAPVPGGVADCTHKSPMLAVEGVASAGTRRFDLAGSAASLDHTTGLLAYDTRWRWASGGTTALAFNLTEGFTAPHENALWSDGALRPLPPVAFVFDTNRPERPWRITDHDGVVELEFHPEGVRRARTNLLVARSLYVQPVGAFRGIVGGVQVDDIPGVTEDHLARW